MSSEITPGEVMVVSHYNTRAEAERAIEQLACYGLDMMSSSIVEHALCPGPAFTLFVRGEPAETERARDIIRATSSSNPHVYSIPQADQNDRELPPSTV